MEKHKWIRLFEKNGWLIEDRLVCPPDCDRLRLVFEGMDFEIMPDKGDGNRGHQHTEYYINMAEQLLVSKGESYEVYYETYRPLDGIISVSISRRTQNS